MSYTRHGQLVAGQYRIQPRAKTTYSRHGLAKRTEVWAMNTTDFLTLAPKPGVTFNTTLPNLLCTECEAEDATLGLCYATVLFEGISGSGSGSGDSALPPPVYTLSGVPYTFTLDTIEDAKWTAIRDYIYGIGGASAYNAAFENYDPTGKFQKFPKEGTGRYAGQDTYDDGGLFWRVDYVTRSSQRGLLANYQKIATPKGPAPSIPGRDWRLVDFQERDLVNIYDVSLGYLLSGPNGNDPIIYGPTPAS